MKLYIYTEFDIPIPIVTIHVHVNGITKYRYRQVNNLAHGKSL